MADPVLAREFGVTFQGAIDNLKGKLPEATMKWDDLAGPVHGKVFAIAGAVNTDVVSDIHKSLVSALEKGTTITQFRKDFDATVQKSGWTYKGKRGWRTKVIFDNNMRSAHMAGRWEQLLANQDNRPYLQYRTAGDARVRQQHRQWNGLIYPISDSFWQTHYPPNGWGCRCTIRAYSGIELIAKDMFVSKPFDFKTREVISKDGEFKDIVPLGIDPGWDHNVGQSWLAPELALGQKLARLPRALQGKLVDKTISPAFQTVLNARFKTFRTAIKAAGQGKGDWQIVGYLDSSMLNMLASRLPDTVVESTAVRVLDKKTTKLEGQHKAEKSAPVGQGRRALGAPWQVWPSDWIDSLPYHLRNYQAVLLDKLSGNLVVVPQDSFNDKLLKIVLKLNTDSKLGKTVSVVSLGSATKRNLEDANSFELLIGRLK